MPVISGRLSRRRLAPCLALACAAAFGGTAQAVGVVFEASSADVAGLTPTVDAFRAALGSLNPNVAGSFASGRREINWDGVPDIRSAPNALPADFFNVNSPRGVVFSTPGSGFEVSGKAGVAPVEFGDIDPAYPGFFDPFSPQRLFTAIGSNVVDVTFFVPGSTQATATRGFGAVFSDVDLADTTSITFFDAGNVALDMRFVPVSGAANQGFSFLGVDFGTAVVSRVRIVSGNQALAPGAVTGDVVAMDDFVYGEPIAAVPEPETYALMIVGLAALGALRRRRRPA